MSAMTEMQAPLIWWRRNIMPKVTTVPTALLRENEGLVQEGDILAVTGKSGRSVRLCSVVPDEDGMITVQETYRVTPITVGLHVRPEKVVLELSRDEATAVLAFYHDAAANGRAKPSEPATDVLEALKEEEQHVDHSGS